MAKNLSREEYSNLDKEEFVQSYKDFVKEYFSDNYGDLFEVGEITMGNYFEQIDEELEKYKTFQYVPISVWSKDSTVFLKISFSNLMKVDKIDKEKFADIISDSIVKYNWQNQLYAEIKLFFEFFRMPYIVPWIKMDIY